MGGVNDLDDVNVKADVVVAVESSRLSLVLLVAAGAVLDDVASGTGSCVVVVVVAAAVAVAVDEGAVSVWSFSSPMLSCWLIVEVALASVSPTILYFFDLVPKISQEVLLSVLGYYYSQLEMRWSDECSSCAHDERRGSR